MFRCHLFNFFYAVLPLKMWRDYLIRRHLEACPSCQARLASREEAAPLLMAESDIGPQPSLWPRVKDGLAVPRVSGAGERRAQGEMRWRWAAAGAGILIVGLSSFLVLKDYKPGPGAAGNGASETFRINYLKVEDKPAQAYLYRPRGSNLVIIWAEKPS
jgi:hypothetical protein